MSQHVSVRAYLGVFLALLVLTAVTVWVAEHDFGLFNTPVALAIAGLKATLVAIWFMHLKVASRFTVLVAAAGVLWLGIMIALTLADYLSRAAVQGWT